jgi:AraC-like DNA-binding protein
MVLPSGAECFEARFHTHTFERHIHDTFAIGVTLSGVQRFWCGGVTYDSRAGDVMVIAPGRAHDGESGTGGFYSYRMAYLPDTLIRDILADASEAPHDLQLTVPAPVLPGAPVARALGAAWSRARSAQTRDDLVDAFYEPVVDLARRFSNARIPEPSKAAPAQLARIVDYLHAHVEREIPALELARLAGMSRFRLTREFSRTLGLPIHAYHVHVRLEASKQLLRSGLSVAAAAAQLGFCDQSHFHRRFKGAFGITPAQWQAGAQCRPKR